MPGFKAEALRVDPQTHETTWVTPYEGSDEVKVAQDLGNGLQDETGAPRLQAELGNEGVRSGVVRVTNAEGDQKYYVLGAKFEGKPDDWNVTGAIAEVTPVTPDQPHALPGVRLELPAGE